MQQLASCTQTETRSTGVDMASDVTTTQIESHHVPYWFSLAKDLEAWALSCDDIDRRSNVLSVVHQFMGRVVLTCKLLDAFNISPRRAIEGKGSVSEQLGMSKSAVYLAIKELELTTEDFRDHNATLEGLLEKSDVVGQDLSNIKDLHADCVEQEQRSV